jgi:hypothetical protein
MKRILIHRHQYGISTAFCNFEGFKQEDLLMSEEDAIKVAKLCGLDYEPAKGEDLEIISIDDEGITTITKDMLQ